MSPEKAKICVIDDMQEVIEDLQGMFEASDHEILLTAQTKDDGLKAVDQFEQYGIDIVFLDTKLVYGDREGRQAREVLEKIRLVAPDVKIITMSSGKPLDGGDVKMTKNFITEQHTEQLLNFIDNL